MRRPSWSKQDYDAVAGILHSCDSVEAVSAAFAEMFHKDNPRFELDRWNHAVATGEIFPRRTTRRARAALEV